MDTYTVGERAYHTIRDGILRGVLAPGVKLKLDHLRATYGVSTTTLREILNRLVSEKLVLAEGQRGFEVMAVSTAHLREIAELRTLLEREALRLSFALGDVEWESRVIAAHYRLERQDAAERSGANVDQWLRFDSQFHHALISACASNTLLAAHATVMDRYMRYQFLTLRVSDDEQTIQDHRAFLAAALARDTKAATTLIGTHIDRGAALALQSGLIP